jgi:TrmH family RNA methyltransferase
LLRDRGVRDAEHAFVVEGPRAVSAALTRNAPLESVYLAPGAASAFPSLLDELRAARIPTLDLKDGVVERVATTVTPQPILAVAPFTRGDVERLPDDGVVLVLVSIQDPGNAGTLLRSAEASGLTGVVSCGNSVDLHGPKVVRSSAGAIFGLAIAEGDDPMEVLATLGARGRRRIGATTTGGAAPDRVDLTGPLAIVVGNEARGLPDEIRSQLDETVTIPVAAPTVDSLNVAMAGTVLCFEAARQRRMAGA